MAIALTRVLAPTSYPVTATQVKAQCRIDGTDDDTWIDDAIAAGTRYVEEYTRRQLITATWEQYLDEFPSGTGDDARILIARPPLQSISSIEYTDTDGNSQTVSSSDYRVDAISQPGRVEPAYGKTWPTARDVSNAVKITFIAGYGAASAVPEPIKHAILMLIGHWYENRETVVVGTISKPIELAFQSLLSPYRMPEIM